MTKSFRLPIAVCLVLFGCSFSLRAEDFQKKLNRLTVEWTRLPQEKIYLQTDKPYYSAGESIWLKPFLVNATTHELNALSQFVYVELINQSDSVVTRVKIRKEKAGFAGKIDLKPELPAGNYQLRAYTYWMQNAGVEYFFSKNIYIGNPIDDNVLSNLTFEKPVNGKVNLTLSLTNGSKVSLNYKKLSLQETKGRLNGKVIRGATDGQGKFTFQLAVLANDTAKHSLQLIVNEADCKYRRRFYLPSLNNDFDITFFPESGNMLQDQLQTMAFKAIGTNGLAVEVQGSIYNEAGEFISEFSTTHKGMGKAALVMQAGHQYYAMVKSSGGLEKKVTLPMAQKEGIALHVASMKDKIRFELLNQTALPNASLHLLVHSRGQIVIHQTLSNTTGQIDKKNLPAGILTLAVLDSIGNALCERLVFVDNNAFYGMTMTSDRTVYNKRSPVNLSFQLQRPGVANLSMSVTDDELVRTDSLQDNIVSHLLLCSDLKGHIEDPGGYFVTDDAVTRDHLDVLMLTQGWRRFNVSEILKSGIKTPAYYLEAGQALSGKVVNLFSKPAKKADIIMISPYHHLLSLTQTDSLGKYLIGGIEFPDSTSFILKAKKKKTLGDVEIIPDPDLFPSIKSYFYTDVQSGNTATNDYLKVSRDKYFYEGGMRVIGLNEVVVKASKIENPANTYFYSGMSDAKISSEEIEKRPGTSILTLLSTIPGVSVMGDKVSIRGSLHDPMFMIDGIETENIEDISYLSSNDVSQIEVFKGANAAIFGSRGGNGVIAITLKTGVEPHAKISTSLTKITPLGYQKASEFYVPKYDVDSIRQLAKPDLRTTIYWNPNLVSDSTGVFTAKFFTADTPNNYRILVEGVSENGEIFRYVGVLKRENE